MKTILIIIMISVNNLNSMEKFFLKAHSAIVNAATEYTSSEVKEEINKYIDFILAGAGEYKSSSDYSEDGSKDLFNEIYICKPVSSAEHFYDPYNPNYVPLWNRCRPVYGKSNALNRARYIYEEFAIKYYLRNEKDKAYYYLGRVLHILADLSIPAHTHYTLHPFWPIDDRYERFHNELRIKEEYLNNIKKVSYDKFDDYFINIAKETSRYPSDFDDGYSVENNYYYNNRGKIDYYSNGFNSPLNDESCEEISRKLVPLSISYSAGFLEFFYKNVKGRNNEKN